MKINKKLYVGLAVGLVLVSASLSLIPVYSKQIEGCEPKGTSFRRSLLLGDTQNKIDNEAQELLDMSSRYDCDINTVTYKLYFL